MSESDYKRLLKAAGAALQHQGRAEHNPIQYQGARAYIGPRRLKQSTDTATTTSSESRRKK